MQALVLILALLFLYFLKRFFLKYAPYFHCVAIISLWKRFSLLFEQFKNSFLYLVWPNILFLRRSKKCESLRRDRWTDEQRDVEQRVIKKVHLYIWFRWAETWISVVINALLIACLHWTRNFVSFFRILDFKLFFLNIFLLIVKTFFL